MCPSYLATREEKDSTRGRARVLQEALDGSLVHGPRRPGRARGARPLPVLQGLRLRLPDRRRHGERTRPRRCTRPYAGRRRPAVPLHAGPAAALGARWRRRWPGSPTGRCAGPLARLAKAVAGVDQRRSLPELAPGTLRRGLGQLDRAGGRAGRLDLGRLVHRPLPPADRARRDRGARGRRADRVAGDPRATPAAALTWITTGQLDRARGSSSARSPRWRRTSRAGCRSSGSSRPAWPRCAPTPSS